MAKQLIKNYTFSAAGKTVTLTDFGTVRLDRLQLIVNTTTNKILYNFADNSVTTAAVATNVVTLAALQGGEADTDKLQIIYDVTTGDPVYDGGQRAMANSAPVVIANDQSAVPVSGTVTANIGTSGSLALDATLTGGNQQVQGNVADSATDSGNPVKIGGINKTTPPTLTDGQRGNAQLDTRANMKVSLWAPNSNTAHTYGNGVSGTGVQRVAIASDNSAVSGMGVGATGSAVPANANYIGVSDGTNLRGVLQAANALNSTGTGLPTAQIVGQFDDVSPTAITENQFGNLRMSANRNLYGTIRDAAGNERGANVTAGNALQIDNTSIAGTALAVNNGTASAGTQRVTIASDSTGQVALAAGTALVGKVGIDQTTPGTTNAVVDTPVTSGGLSIVTGSVGATATAIKASAGQLYGYHLFNTTAAVAYVQIFNVAAASVTLGTTAPTFSIGIPASGGVTVNFDKGIAFGTAISFACTTTRTGSSGATCDVNFFYK